MAKVLSEAAYRPMVRYQAYIGSGPARAARAAAARAASAAYSAGICSSGRGPASLMSVSLRRRSTRTFSGS